MVEVQFKGKEGFLKPVFVFLFLGGGVCRETDFTVRLILVLSSEMMIDIIHFQLMRVSWVGNQRFQNSTLPMLCTIKFHTLPYYS